MSIKNSLAILAAISLVGTSTSTAFAADHTDVTEIAASLIQSALTDSHTTLKLGSYALSDPITAYSLAEGEIGEFDEAVHYVVYCDEEPVAIFTENGANTQSPTYSLSEGFVDKLADAALDTNSEYNLVITENQIFTVTDENATEIARYDMMPVDNGSDVPTVMNSISQDYTPSEVMECVDQASTLVYDVTEATTDLNVIQTRALPNSVQVSGTVKPYLQAAGSNWCWAASSWCIGECLNPLNKTVNECVEYCGKDYGDGGSIDDQKKIMEDIYDLSPKSYGTLTESEMIALIDNDEPFAMNCYKGSGLGHTVTCYAYNEVDFGDSTTHFAVMDSLGGGSAWQWMTNSGSSYKITSAGTTYTYETTVTPNGKA